MNMKTHPLTAVRAKTVLTLAGEGPSRGMEALCRPLPRLDDGIIVAEDGVIQIIEPYRDYRRRPDALPENEIRDLGDGVLTPGLINCHVHLEISHMAGKTTMGRGFRDWLASLVALDRNPPTTVTSDLATAIRSMADAGTACAGDISSRMPHAVLDAVRASGMEARVFREIIGHADAAVKAAKADAAGDAAFSLAGHAFYTTPGEAMVMAKQWCDAHSRPFSLHLAEHEDEVQFLVEEAGEFNAVLRRSMVPASWRAPRMRPVQYAASLGLLAPGTLAVHCVQCDAADIATLAAGGAAVCLCPRSNLGINVGEAPARTFAEKGIPLVLGTDSLASNTDLDVWNEAEFFLKKNIFPANALLRMATVNGAAALGLEHLAGRLEKGRRFWYRVFPSELAALLR